MSFIGRLFTSTEDSGRSGPWPGRAGVTANALRDWWVIDCWYHVGPDPAEAHYERLVNWMAERPPDSFPHLSWAPYTKLRIDLTCLRSGATPEIEKRCRDEHNRFYVLALCHARNEQADVEQYHSVWRESPEYAGLAQMVDNSKGGWPRRPVRVTPNWYYLMTLKTAASCWLGYRGFEDHNPAETG